jgi:3-oxoacyl-[acyl-carrier-protein] synthase II
VTRRAVLTGRGVCSPLGCDWPSFAAAVRSGRSAPLAHFPGSPPDDEVLLHVLAEPLEDADRREPLAALATEAVRAALAEAAIATGGEPLDDVGLVMNTVFGPSTAVEAYLERLRERGPRAARPAQFVDTLLSMPASRVGIALALRGSTAVLGGSDPFELALDWLRRGREGAVVAGGGEFISPKTLRYYAKLVERSCGARPRLAQGAGFLVVEAEERARERAAPVVGELLGAGSASEPQDIALPWSAGPEGRAFAAAMRRALADAEVGPSGVALVALAAGDDASEAGELAAVGDVLQVEKPVLLRPKRLLGEALGASGALGLLAALAMLDSGGVALVNAFEMGGAVSSVVVRAP